ncbi:Nif11-like leader peptide family RiPP precursor [Sporomusa malonica]|uniref:Nif11-like leader peptide domain-containing protein n=1 Tax=Sporomusa malonica TaxID=112901 RepID=A0A1W2ECC9_9FIRM|nr:Nif11-like leader peptide family RiPP precursor [Sporomusa malonica]SMD07390.1 nif11-like leader peptide domain-containing protein [Sporomusa malonica]
MSIESAKKFVERMKSDHEFATAMNALKSLEEAQKFLNQSGYDFTKEELNQVNGELQDSDLDNVTGGAFPTSVNDQITDSVT